MSLYAIREVDGGDEDVIEDIKHMHSLTLPDDAVPDTSKGRWWIAYINKGLTAVAFAGLNASRSWVNTGYLCRSGVLPAFRGHGLQRRLILVREKAARLNGWPIMLADTRDNVPSANNLISCGYKLYRPTTPYGFEDTLYWRRRIIADANTAH